MSASIPITIGITGHRDLNELQIEEARDMFRADLLALKEKYKHSKLVMLNSLADGADIICAEVAYELEIPVRVILPYALDDYKKTISPEYLPRFETALTKADSVETIESRDDDFCDVSPLSDVSATTDATATTDVSALYRKAGIYVADHSHILYSIWDGKEGKSDGCGSADMVYYLEHNAKDYLIKHIKMARANAPEDEALKKPSINILGSKNSKGEFSILEALDQTEEYNQNVAACEPEKTSEQEKSSEPEKTSQAEIASQQPKTSQPSLDSIYEAADSLSLSSQKKYISRIRALAIIGVLMVLAFLFYDELNLSLCMIIYCALLACGAVILFIEKKQKSHEHYINYRMLAETIRVQKVFYENAVDCNSATFFPMAQSENTLWVKKAIDAVSILIQKKSARGYNADWISEQLEYHKNALIKSEGNNKTNNTISKIATVVTIILIAGALILEIFARNLMDYQLIGQPVKIWIVILIGIMSATSLLLSSYYGKMNLDRKIIDHQNMIALYEWGEKQIAEHGLTEEIIKDMVREEVIENVNWYSYTKEKKLDICI